MDRYDKLRGVMRRAAGILAAAALLALSAATAPGDPPVLPERALYTDAPNGMFLIEDGWSTRADPSDAGLRSGWQREGAVDGFAPVSVPNAFNAGDLSRASFVGRVQWYRVSFNRPELDGVTGWRLRFESVNVAATVWLNGAEVGRHRGAYLPFELPADQLRAGANELVVRVDSRGNAGDLPPANRPRGWWNYGGILREVYLRAVRTFDLNDLRVTAGPGTPAHARLTATVRNTAQTAQPLTAAITVRGPNGFNHSTVEDEGQVAPGETKDVAATIDIPDPQPWTPARPALYELTIETPGGQRTTTHFGIRKWGVRGDGRLLLNGKPLVLRGASFHEQTAEHGAALTPGDRETIVRELAKLGANFARQHYPPHPALLEAFDREGIVFWEQIPVWRVRGKQLRSAGFRATALNALRDAVLRDRNHASVLAWSVSNETLRGGSGEAAYLRAARALVSRLDPSRLLAADKALHPLDDLPRTYRLLDAIGLNEYVGWYGGRTSQLPGNLASVHRKFPRQALVVTEFGAEANRGGSARQKGTYRFQQAFLRKHLSVFDKSRYLSGALVWLLRDVAIRPGWAGGNPRPRPPILAKGLLTQAGSPKPALATVRRSFDRALSR